MLIIINKAPVFVENNQQNEIKEKRNLPKTPVIHRMFLGKY
jgi:hypothetical protein